MLMAAVLVVVGAGFLGRLRTEGLRRGRRGRRRGLEARRIGEGGKENRQEGTCVMSNKKSTRDLPQRARKKQSHKDNKNNKTESPIRSERRNQNERGTPAPRSAEGTPSPESEEGTPATKKEEEAPAPRSAEGTPAMKGVGETPAPESAEGATTPKSVEGIPAPASAEARKQRRHKRGAKKRLMTKIQRWMIAMTIWGVTHSDNQRFRTWSTPEAGTSGCPDCTNSTQDTGAATKTPHEKRPAIL